MLTRAALAVVALTPLLLVSACGSSGNDKATDTTSSDTTSAATTTAAGGAGTCTYKSDGAGSAGIKVTPPPATPTVSGKVPATIHTSAGDLKLTLAADTAPCTVNSFVSLAKQGFYDKTTCHRLGTVPGFSLLQCGDPTGSGQGGPGYSFDDELSGKETYGAGTLAMANAGPDTNGSQFFLVFGDTQLPPSYTVFGTLDPSAIAVLEKVAAAGTDNSEEQGVGHPKENVTFTSISVG